MSSSDTPVVIEVALTTNPRRNPNTAGSVEEVIKQGLACIDAGASIVHMHIPDLHVPAEEAARQYLECFTPWLQRDADVLTLPTNGYGDTLEERFDHQFRLHDAGALRLAFVDPGAVVFGSPGPDGAPEPAGYVYSFNFDAISYAIDQGARRGMGMHFACFEPGWLRNVMSYWRAGRLSPGSFVKFYFGGEYGVLARGRGVTFGLPPTLTALAAYREILEIEGCPLPWFSAVVGGDLIATPVAAATVEQGGHLRVGLEDYAGDRTPTNAELVEEAVALCEKHGRAVATPAETIDILELPRGRQ
ncbi:MAG: 3-keto-5-aminohexanoate cleavage protein [Acidimicrobiaceae bacterium]|nr:3-keto-5-aminohexanoate cleavage protein [Acidimicrobiaceae bacterium]